MTLFPKRISAMIVFTSIIISGYIVLGIIIPIFCNKDQNNKQIYADMYKTNVLRLFTLENQIIIYTITSVISIFLLSMVLLLYITKINQKIADRIKNKYFKNKQTITRCILIVLICLVIIIVALVSQTDIIHNRIIDESPYNKIIANHKLKVIYLWPCLTNCFIHDESNNLLFYNNCMCKLNKKSQYTYKDGPIIYIELLMNECLNWTKIIHILDGDPINELKIENLGPIINSTNNNGDIIYNEYNTTSSTVKILDNLNLRIFDRTPFIAHNINQSCPNELLKK